MSRYSALAFDGRFVINSIGRNEKLQILLNDRHSNNEAFNNEKVIRLPRRLSRRSPVETETMVIHRLMKWTHP